MTWKPPADTDPTPPLDEFLAEYANEKIWWSLGPGHMQNLFDEAVERMERFRLALIREATCTWCKAGKLQYNTGEDLCDYCHGTGLLERFHDVLGILTP